MFRARITSLAELRDRSLDQGVATVAVLVGGAAGQLAVQLAKRSVGLRIRLPEATEYDDRRCESPS